MNSVLVSCQWLEDHLHDDNLIILDVSMDKVVGKSPLVYDCLQAIPTSIKCSLESDFSDIDSEAINAFPTQVQFEKGLEKFGIGKNSTVILYDNQGVYSSPRAWWIFKTMGFQNAYILNGGLPQWIKEQRETSNMHQVSDLNSDHPFKSSFHSEHVCSSDLVLNTIANNKVTVLDARSNARYLGQEKEPRAGMRSGHIPNSINIPFSNVLDHVLDNGIQFKSKDELFTLFTDKIPPTTEQLIFSCGSGITACIVLAAAMIAGFTNLTLYDGSWAEWGSNNYPVSTS